MESKLTPLAKVTWTWPGATILLLFAMIPVYAQFLPILDGAVEPVTSKIGIINPIVDPDDPGSLLFRFAYTKYRACEYISTDAQIKGAHVDFENTEGPNGTRVPGRQLSQLWRLHASSLDGLNVYFIHRCNPLALTITHAYP